MRAAVDHTAGAEFFKVLLEAADDIADSLEEAAFHFTLFPPGTAPADAHGRLRALADLLVGGAQEYLKALTTARYVRRGGDRDDMRDFLEGGAPHHRGRARKRPGAALDQIGAARRERATRAACSSCPKSRAIWKRPPTH